MNVVKRPFHSWNWEPIFFGKAGRRTNPKHSEDFLRADGLKQPIRV